MLIFSRYGYEALSAASFDVPNISNTIMTVYCGLAINIGNLANVLRLDIILAVTGC